MVSSGLVMVWRDEIRWDEPFSDNGASSVSQTFK